MYTRRRIVKVGMSSLAVSCGCAATPVLFAASPAGAAAVYRCPPCGCAMDERRFDAPGKCPACGMTLVPQTEQPRADEGEQGTFEVPENRLDPRSRRISLSYLRLRSTAQKPGHPIVYLAGGPGGSGIFEARGRSRALFDALRSVSDVIALDQRGTGASNAIPACETNTRGLTEILLTREGMTRYFGLEYRRCREFWKASGVAIDGYNTLQSAADLEDLRRALGASKLNLLGESYGSLLAMAALKYHRASIGRVALASLEAPHQTVKRPASVDAIFELVAARLAADPKRRAEFPDFLALVRRVHQRLEREPARVVLQPNPDAPPITIVIGAFIVQYLAGNLVKNPESLRDLPAYYRRLDAGQYTPLAQQLHAMTRGFTLPMRGMNETMDLASGISADRLALVEKEAKKALLGDALNFPMPHAREVASGFDLGDEFRAPTRCDAQALLIAGTLDGRTPLSEQREAGARFSAANWIVVENAGHDLLATTVELRPLLTKFFSGSPVPDTGLHAPELDFS